MQTLRRDLLCVLVLLMPACSGSESSTTDGATTVQPTTEAMTTEAESTAGESSEVTEGTDTGDTTAPGTSEDGSDSETEGETEGPPVGHAAFVLSGEDYPEVDYAWTNDAGNLVYCYYYQGEAKGDYMWIRFAESSLQNGDDSPHIDLDVCRFSSDGFGGTFPAMDPTKFGSQCQADPGFGIWWHEGSVAYNNEPMASDCQLTASVQDGVVYGEFECTPLPEVEGSKTLAVTAGEFSCIAEAK